MFPPCIASVNTHKNLRSPKRMPRISNWLKHVQPDVLLVQEPCMHNDENPTSLVLPEYSYLGGNTYISFFARQNYSIGSYTVTEHVERWWTLFFEGWALHNVYLDPYARRARCEVLEQMAALLTISAGIRHLVMGDFNCTPRIEDGMHGEHYSSLTSDKERQAIHSVCEAGNLVDLFTEHSEIIEFSYEQMTANGNRSAQLNRQRCDLALVPGYLSDSHALTMAYDHTIRQKGTPGKFTDHSAILLYAQIDALTSKA